MTLAKTAKNRLDFDIGTPGLLKSETAPGVLGSSPPPEFGCHRIEYTNVQAD